MRPKSFIEKSGPNGTVTVPCFTCAHCQKIVEVPRQDEPGGFCLKCFHHVCLECGGAERCTPFEKKVEEYEKRYYQRQRFFEAL